MAALLGESKAAAKPSYNRRAMTAPSRYFDLIREMKNPFNHRLRLVTYARQKGVKGTAREVRSGLLFLAFAQRVAVPPPVPSSPLASGALSPAMASISATWSGKPTTAASSSAATTLATAPPASPPLSTTATTSAFPPVPTPTTATSKPSIVSSKMNSSIWKPSPAGAISLPKPLSTSSTSTSSALTPTRVTNPPGRSSSGSLPARTLLASSRLLGLLP